MNHPKPIIHGRTEMRRLASLEPAKRNARTHSRKQLKQIASSIERFGFTNPVLVDEAGRIVAGHGRVEAARLGASSLRLLNQSTHSSVAYSTASKDRHGPRRWITSAL